MKEDAAFFDAVENSSDENNKLDAGIFNYIIKQKDVIIFELREQIRILNNHIEVLSNSVQNVNRNVDSMEQSQQQKLNKTKSVEGDKKCTINNSKQKATVVSEISENTNTASGVSHTKTEDTTPTNTKNEGQWERVKNRRARRNVVIGNNKSSDIKGVPKYVDLHVCRVNPETSADDLTQRLKHKFPEVKCQPLTSKQPNLYASFKVSVFGKNFKESMSPEVWPDGVVISRFLYPRTKRTQQET
ncbi:hypothetical protein NQ317_007510 [Molorchus minor]|uniref:Transposase n=1 Tax=Molorchus minor TaxID=1323400 RepID=A0ABQ9J0E8_9CUCU|nr:hypothetical protein NQ317_007510 [Molorchus minor]